MSSEGGSFRGQVIDCGGGGAIYLLCATTGREQRVNGSPGGDCGARMMRARVFYGVRVWE